MPILRRIVLGAAWGLVVGALAFGGGDPRDLLGDRSHEVLDLDCRSGIERRRVTLFGNGTVRLLVTRDERRRMELGELGREETLSILERLSKEDLSEVDVDRLSPEGDWVESCLLTLDLGEGAVTRYGFSRFDSLPLPLSRVVSLADELADRTRASSSTDIPADYVPDTGDVLRRSDGFLFEVISFTSDGRGVELQGVDQPLTIYVRPEDIRQVFVSVERSGR